MEEIEIEPTNLNQSEHCSEVGDFPLDNSSKCIVAVELISVPRIRLVVAQSCYGRLLLVLIV